MEEVQINTSQATECNATETRRNIRIVVVGNEFEKIDELSRLMSKEDRDAFNRRYGQILDLLAIRVKTKSLSALAQFWNTDLRCFELPNLDMVPTIEEYGLMIAKLIGLLPNQLKFEKRGSILGLRRTFLEDRLKVLAEQGHWKHFKITLALTIYGLILFPFTSDMVDQAAMDVFFQFEENGANPVPAILADTFLSMMICHQKKGGSLRCCSHMLYVWIMTHLYARHTMGPSPDPLRDFDSVPTKDFDARGWIEEFSHTKDNQITWVCPWYHFEGVIFSCGNFRNIPLMGPMGCVAYTPSIVLRQLKCTQIKPVEEPLGGASFLYGRKLEHAKKLKVEQDQLQSQVEKLKRVEEEKNGWELLAGYQQNRKKEWIRTCEDMADCVHTQATNLANHVHDAVEEVNSNPEIKLPWKTFRLMKFCQDVVRSLVRQ
ncbi:hypothetical protein SESBI_48949 [Sesbania bispinosa]|nr:hypothetical protein SESBI_48949 [Sesbania bispinosa]